MRCRPALTTRPTSTTRFPGQVRSLRTQQRAYNQPTTNHPVPHAPKDAVLGAAAAAGRTGQRSTLEHHPRSVQPPRDWGTIVS